jgi:hypothetical protein
MNKEQAIEKVLYATVDHCPTRFCNQLVRTATRPFC